MTAAGRTTVARLSDGDVILVEPAGLNWRSTTRKLTGKNDVVAARIAGREVSRAAGGYRRSVTLTSFHLADPATGEVIGQTGPVPPSQTFALAPTP